MRSRILIALLVVAMIGATGCTRFQRYSGSMGAVGAGIGAGYGAYGWTGVSAGEGAAIGGVSGGLIGAITADQFDETDWEGMEAELAALRQDNDDQAIALASKDRLLEERDMMLAAMQSEIRDSEARNAMLASQIESLRNDLSDKGIRLASLQEEIAARDNKLASLQSELGSRVEVGSNAAGGVTLTILDELLFSAGRANLSSEGEAILSDIADMVRASFPESELIIEGHTDNQPITRSAWRSNWELGSARALSVLHYLKDRELVDPTRLSAVSRADTMPTASNSTEDGRSMNRRAVIIIMPPAAMERVPYEPTMSAGPAVASSVAFLPGGNTSGE
jgi:chemotaxis protein MotB